MDAVANKLIMVIVALSAVMTLCGLAVHMYISGSPEPSVALAVMMGVNNAEGASVADAIPFGMGVGAVMFLNIAKVLLMKRAVSNAVQRDAVSAKLYLQGQYFTRLVLTAAVLFLVGWLHNTQTNEAGNPQYINFFGAFFGIFTFPLAMYSMRFFMREALEDSPLPQSSEKSTKSVTQSAIDELNAIGAEQAAEESAEETESEVQ